MGIQGGRRMPRKLIVAAIERERKRQGMTVYRLGKMAGMENATIAVAMKRGRMTTDNADKCLRALGLEVVRKP